MIDKKINYSSEFILQGELDSTFLGNSYYLPVSYVNFNKFEPNIFSDFKRLCTHKSFVAHKIEAFSSMYIHTPTTYSIFGRFQRPLRIIIIIIIILLLLLAACVGRSVVARGGIYSKLTVASVLVSTYL